MVISIIFIRNNDNEFSYVYFKLTYGKSIARFARPIISDVIYVISTLELSSLVYVEHQNLLQTFLLNYVALLF
jgi:hypothetical protein